MTQYIYVYAEPCTRKLHTFRPSPREACYELRVLYEHLYTNVYIYIYKYITRNASKLTNIHAWFRFGCKRLMCLWLMCIANIFESSVADGEHDNQTLH